MAQAVSLVGELKQTDGELTVEWEIANFFSLSDEVDKRCHSPLFYFSDSTWYLQVYPNGQSFYKSEGYIGIYVTRQDPGPSRSLAYKLFFKTEDGAKEKMVESKRTFRGKNNGWGVTKALLRSSLLERKSELAPSGVLTVVCSLKQDDDGHVLGNSLLRRLQNVSVTLREILTEGKRSDVALKVGTRNFSAHRVILESRSPVFAAMFGHFMEEERTGVVNIQDVHPDAFQAALTYMYSGEVDSLSFKNVFQIYQAADKYDLRELTQLCTAFMKANLSEEHVCDVIKFADLFQEEELGRDARDYFNKNYKQIVKTESWKTFRTENQELAMDILESSLNLVFDSQT